MSQRAELTVAITETQCGPDVLRFLGHPYQDVLSWKSWVAQFFELEEFPVDAIKEAAQFLHVPHSQICDTLDLLRGNGLLSEESVSHFFSLLKPSRKNLVLKKLLLLGVGLKDHYDYTQANKKTLLAKGSFVFIPKRIHASTVFESLVKTRQPRFKPHRASLPYEGQRKRLLNFFHKKNRKSLLFVNREDPLAQWGEMAVSSEDPRVSQVFFEEPLDIEAPESELLWYQSQLPGLLTESELLQVRSHGYDPLNQPLKGKQRLWIYGGAQKSRIHLSSNSVAIRSQKQPRFQKKISRSYDSSTQLDTYAQCPAKYYYRYGVNLRKEQTDWRQKFHRYLGDVVHETLYQMFQSKKPSAEIELQSIIDDILMKVITQNVEVQKEPTQIQRYLKEESEKRIQSYFECEKIYHQMFGLLVPTYLEHEFVFKMGHKNLKGRFDRVDQNSRDQLVIIDYKTGNVKFSPSSMGKSQFQLPLYIEAAQQMFQKPVLGMVFFDLKNAEVKRGWVNKTLVPEADMTRGHAVVSEKFHEKLEMSREGLRHQMQSCEYFEYHVTPKSQNCQSCDYPSVCLESYGTL